MSCRRRLSGDVAEAGIRLLRPRLGRVTRVTRGCYTSPSRAAVMRNARLSCVTHGCHVSRMAVTRHAWLSRVTRGCYASRAAVSRHARLLRVTRSCCLSHAAVTRHAWLPRAAVTLHARLLLKRGCNAACAAFTRRMRGFYPACMTVTRHTWLLHDMRGFYAARAAVTCTRGFNASRGVKAHYARPCLLCERVGKHPKSILIDHEKKKKV